MTKLTTAIAYGMVARIEALQNQIHAIYAEADGYDGSGNSNVIRHALKARAARRNAEDSESALLGSLKARAARRNAEDSESALLGSFDVEEESEA